MKTLSRQAVRAFSKAINMSRAAAGAIGRAVVCEGLEGRTLLSANLAVDQVGHLGGQVSAIAVSGSYAYANQGQDLLVIDMTAAGGPQVTGKVTLADVVRDIAVSGQAFRWWM